MSAFDNIDRSDIEPASHLIGGADYLNASARPEAARVRDFVDRLLEQYPPSHRDGLIRRLRSRDDSNHRSAWLELLLHGLMVARGFTVIAVEPVQTNGRAPDFLVEAPDGREFFLEATVAEGEIGADPGADRRLRDVLQAIDEVRSQDFFLSLYHRGLPAQPIRLKHLRGQVQQFIDGLDYDTVLAGFEANRPAPFFSFNENGLILRVAVVPKNVRQASGRAIGDRTLPGGIIYPHLPIKAAVENKASRYGRLDRPYIIAVSALDQFAGPNAAIDALFGTDAIVVTEDGAHALVGNRDGVWFDPSGPRYTRVSAVLSTERLSPWDVGHRRMRLVHNPWATRPILDLPMGVDVHQVADERLHVTPGQSLAGIFELPPHWPE